MPSVNELLGAEADALLGYYECTAVFQGPPSTCRAPTYVDRVVASTRTAIRRSCNNFQSHPQHRPPRRHRLHLDTARRPGHRALRRRQLRPEPRCTSTPDNIVKLADRGRLQRRRLDLRRPRHDRLPQVRPQDPLPRQAQPQRAPDLPEHLRPGDVRLRRASAYNLGACAVGATIYFGSDNADRQIQEVAEACSPRPTPSAWSPSSGATSATASFKVDGTDYHVSADGTGQANHLGVTIQADIIKQKQAENNGLYNAVKFGKTHPAVYEKLTPGDHPIELCRYQLACCYNGRAGLINSGGASGGANDLQQAVRTAVINKRAGGMGLISGRKAFQRPMEEGIGLLNAIQDVYTDESITLA
jgi:DhnA family fructose-bisphosphate aldolase class Ia